MNRRLCATRPSVSVAGVPLFTPAPRKSGLNQVPFRVPKARSKGKKQLKTLWWAWSCWGAWEAQPPDGEKPLVAGGGPVSGHRAPRGRGRPADPPVIKRPRQSAVVCITPGPSLARDVRTGSPIVGEAGVSVGPPHPVPHLGSRPRSGGEGVTGGRVKAGTAAAAAGNNSMCASAHAEVRPQGGREGGGGCPGRGPCRRGLDGRRTGRFPGTWRALRKDRRDPGEARPRPGPSAGTRTVIPRRRDSPWVS